MATWIRPLQFRCLVINWRRGRSHDRRPAIRGRDSVASQITANGNIASSINHDLALREHWLWQMEQYRQQTHQHYARYYQQAMETMAAQLRGLRQQLSEVPGIGS